MMSIKCRRSERYSIGTGIAKSPTVCRNGGSGCACRQRNRWAIGPHEAGVDSYGCLVRNSSKAASEMFHALGRLLLRLAPRAGLLGGGVYRRVLFAPPGGTRLGRTIRLPAGQFCEPSGRVLFHRAFPGRLQSSGVVIIVYREGAETDEGTGSELGDQDRAFISDVLKPRLDELLTTEQEASAARESLERPPTVAEIRTFQDRGIGPLLVSADRQASLVVVELSSDFMESAQSPDRRADRKHSSTDRAGRVAPAGLNMALSGSPRWAATSCKRRPAARIPHRPGRLCSWWSCSWPPIGAAAGVGAAPSRSRFPCSCRCDCWRARR